MNESTIKSVIENVSNGGVVVRSDEDFNAHIEAAQRHPRNVENFIQSVCEVIRRDERIASQCFYSIQRSNRRSGEVVKIEGPGVRLAEIMQMYYRNLSVMSRIVEVTDRYVKVQAVGYDAETLNRQGCELVASIVDRDGRRYSDEMIMNVVNATAAKARRNVIFSLIPRVFAEIFVDEARKVIRDGVRRGGSVKVREKFRQAVEEFRSRYNVGEGELLRWLKRGGVDEVTADDIVSLRGLWSALEDGDTTLAAEGLGIDGGNTGMELRVVTVGGGSGVVDGVKGGGNMDVPNEHGELVMRLERVLGDNNVTWEKYREICMDAGLNFVSRAQRVADLNVNDLRVLLKRFNVLMNAYNRSVRGGGGQGGNQGEGQVQG